MKCKQNITRNKQHRVTIATSPLSRFIHHKRRKVKCKLTKHKPVLKMNAPVIGTIEESPQIPTITQIKRSKFVSKITDSSNSAQGSIITMSNECENNCDRFFNLEDLNDSEDDEKFSSVKCFMSFGNEVEPNTIVNIKSNYSTLGDNKQVQHDHDQSTSKRVNRKNVLIDSKEEADRKCSIAVYTLAQETSTAYVYELGWSNYLVVLHPDSFFYFVGVVELQLVRGEVEVLGYNFNVIKNKTLLFSPEGYCKIFIKAKDYKRGLEYKNDVTIKHLLHLGLSEKYSREIMAEDRNCSIFILSRNKDHISSSVWPYFFQKYLPFSVFTPNDVIGVDNKTQMESKLGCILGGNVKEKGQEFVELPEWSEVVRKITSHDSPKVILCGGKSVGKSTLLRYLINKLVKKTKKLLVLDFDPGQCEFTVAGCISVTLVKEPVLGPNFSHLKQPLRSIFLGEVDVTKCPEDYIEGCKYLINFAEKQHGPIPWLVNTMGFSKGFGVTLTCGIIKNVRPTNVIQIQSKDRKLNFPCILKPQFVHSQNVGSFKTDDPSLKYNYHVMQSAAEYQISMAPKIRIGPADARTLVILSYFSNMLNTGTTSVTEVIPFMINIEQIELKTRNDGNLTKEQIAATMNGNMVALCVQEKDDLFPNCLGFGIVRGTDSEAGVLYLITPVASTTLSKINCLIKGKVNLPDSLYYKQGPNVTGHIPYMAHTSGGPTALFAKRDYRMLPTNSRDTTVA